MDIEIRNPWHPEDAKHYTTERMRNDFLIQDLFTPDKVRLVYSHVDRIIVGGVCPAKETLSLEAGHELGVDYFLERRELGVINIGGAGTVILDGEEYDLDYKDGLYAGMGIKEVSFKSKDASNPAKFYLNSAPAHKTYPTLKITMEMANKRPLGSVEECNKRVINQYIHPAVCQSCQLVMGMTSLDVGSNWNTMPCHTHERRMEVYLYFELGEDDVVFHMMGEPQETRHIVMRNEEAVISPSWSIHSGVATKNYTFIWGMVGENQTFDDMDNVAMKDLR